MAAAAAAVAPGDGRSPSEIFNEEHFVKPTWRYRFASLPGMVPMQNYIVEEVERVFQQPTVEEIYAFLNNLFVKAQLSGECSIVCLVYVERLMESAGVAILRNNWRPICLCGMLLASKVWQDLSSWNIEFASVYPEFSVQSINRLERIFLKLLRWKVVVSGSVYAKYYFALRSLNEQRNFRQKYNYIMNINPPNSKRLQERSKKVKARYIRSLIKKRR